MKSLGTKRKQTLHIISQAHLDPVWLWPERDGLAEGINTIQSAIDRMREFSDFKFSRSSAQIYRWVKESDTRLFSEIKKAILKKRWEVLGAWVEQADCNLPSAESFFKQAIIGRKFIESNLGHLARTKIAYVPDSFGHCGGLPQILRQTGFDTYVFMRPCPDENPNLPLIFHWESADGTRVLAIRIPPQYSQSYSATPDDIEKVVREAANANFAPGFDVGAMWFGVGNHGGGPTKEHISRIIELRHDKTLPELRFSTVREFVAAVRKSQAFKDIPVIRGELGYTFRGAYSASGETKALLRECERSLFSAEALQCFSNSKAENIEEAWWNLLFCQFHDILAGTCVSSVQPQIRARFASSMLASSSFRMIASAKIARTIDAGKEKSPMLFVANTLPWRRTVLVQFDCFRTLHGKEEIIGLETNDGVLASPIQWASAEANFGPWGCPWGKLTAQLDLPSFGYKVFRILTKPLAEQEKNPPTDPSNPQFSIASPVKAEHPKEIENKNQVLSSLKTESGLELLESPIGPLVLKDESGTWAHGIKKFDEIIGRPEIFKTEELESGPIISVIRQKSRWENSEIWMDVLKYQGQSYIDLIFRFNWQEKRQTLKLEIPTLLKKTHCFAKMPAEVSERHMNGEEFPCHEWVCLTGEKFGKVANLVLLNNSSYSYSAEDGNLRMILARAVPHAEHPPFSYTDTSNVPFLDQGYQERRFRIFAKDDEPHFGQIDRFAQEFQTEPEIFQDSPHKGSNPWEMSLIEISPADISVINIKKSSDGKSTLLRLQNLSPKPVKASINFAGFNSKINFSGWKIATIKLFLKNGKLNFEELDSII